MPITPHTAIKMKIYIWLDSTKLTKPSNSCHDPQLPQWDFGLPKPGGVRPAHCGTKQNWLVATEPIQAAKHDKREPALGSYKCQFWDKTRKKADFPTTKSQRAIHPLTQAGDPGLPGVVRSMTGLAHVSKTVSPINFSGLMGPVCQFKTNLSHHQKTESNSPPDPGRGPRAPWGC